MKNAVEKAKAWAREKPKAVAVGVILGMPIGLMAVGGYIITTALVFAFLALGALGILIWKMRASKNRVVRKIYGLMTKYPLATDAGATLAVFSLSPKGVIGMLAASVFAVLTSAVLFLLPKGIEETEDEKVAEVCEGQADPAVAAL